MVIIIKIVDRDDNNDYDNGGGNADYNNNGDNGIIQFLYTCA
jgi:hypothetical protein